MQNGYSSAFNCPARPLCASGTRLAPTGAFFTENVEFCNVSRETSVEQDPSGNKENAFALQGRRD